MGLMRASERRAPLDRAFQDLTDSNLLSVYSQHIEVVGDLRREIELRMIERNAIAIPDETFLCKMPKTFVYFPERFTPLKEVLLGEELRECLKPRWTETIEHPESWNTQKVLAAARRYGGEAIRIIEAARVEGRGNLVFKRKEGAP